MKKLSPWFTRELTVMAAERAVMAAAAVVVDTEVEREDTVRAADMVVVALMAVWAVRANMVADIKWWCHYRLDSLSHHTARTDRLISFELLLIRVRKWLNSFIFHIHFCPILTLILSLFILRCFSFSFLLPYSLKHTHTHTRPYKLTYTHTHTREIEQNITEVANIISFRLLICNQQQQQSQLGSLFMFEIDTSSHSRAAIDSILQSNSSLMIITLCSCI